MPKVCPVCGTSYSDANIFCPADGSTLRTAESEHDLVGTVVADRYLITDLLGAGGMGTVYLARHVRLPQQAAIKVLKPALMRDADAVARFNREAANASRIEHERIARVFDYGETSDGTVYLAMEYVPGPTLKALLTTGGPMPAGRVAGIVRQVGDALDMAHRLGIVHRDLKPDNIMVIEDADLGDRCKVVDFGIAKAVGGGSGEPGLTKTGFVVGTPEFMSPEQLFGNDIDHRSDVYALALVAYQCLTGALPFDATTPERTMTARLVESPRALAAARPDVVWPPAIQAVFDRGLAREREQRFESAGAFARALEAAVAGAAVSAAGGAAVSAAGGAAVSAAGDPAIPASGPAAVAPGMSGVAGSAGDGATVAMAGGRAAGSSVAAHATAEPPSPVPTAPLGVPGGAGGSASAPTGASASRRGGPPVALIGAAAVVVLAAVGWLATRGDGGAELNAPAVAVLPDAARPTSVDPDLSVSEPSTPEPDPATNAPTAGTPTGNAPPTTAPSGDDRATRGTPPSTGTPPVAAPPRPAAPTPASPATAEAARFTLDSLFRSFDPATATPNDARRVVGVVRGLMPRLGTAEDSAWGYLRQAEAHFIMEDVRSACLATAAARPLVRTAGQREILGNYAAFC